MDGEGKDAPAGQTDVAGADNRILMVSLFSLSLTIDPWYYGAFAGRAAGRLALEPETCIENEPGHRQTLMAGTQVPDTNRVPSSTGCCDLSRKISARYTFSCADC